MAIGGRMPGFCHAICVRSRGRKVDAGVILRSMQCSNQEGPTMADGNLANLAQARAQAREEAYALPLEKLDPAQPALFQADAMWPIFERLRAEDPVHYTAEHEFGPYWSITKYNDIMAVDTNHQQFSSDYLKGGITITGGATNMDPLPFFIPMDPPRHDVQRKAVSPAVSPHALMEMEPVIRERAGKILDSLPIGEEFD